MYYLIVVKLAIKYITMVRKYEWFDSSEANLEIAWDYKWLIVVWTRMHTFSWSECEEFLKLINTYSCQMSVKLAEVNVRFLRKVRCCKFWLRRDDQIAWHNIITDHKLVTDRKICWSSDDILENSKTRAI